MNKMETTNTNNTENMTPKNTKKSKYPISKEFAAISWFTPKLDPRSVRAAQKMMGKIPKVLTRDPSLDIRTIMIPGYRGDDIELTLITPIGVRYPAPCLFDIHGGGFVFEAASSHYIHAAEYAKGAGCITAFVRYRLGPVYPFPYPQEDSYAALTWIYEHASELNIDPKRIGVCGDSAGGTLAVTSCMMARDRGHAVKPLFQLLVYPFLDDSGQSDSYRKFTDVPMWNSSLSKQVGPLINPVPEATPLAYRSPAQADSFASLPPAYIEVAEFDALHDDGVLYRDLLEAEGIEVEFHETKGTMHGFDYVTKAPTTGKMVETRIAYMKRMFG